MTSSWRLRRLHRWQAQLFEDAGMPVRETLAQIDSVMRHETVLHRQIDSSIKMLGRELPHLFAPNARQEALDDLGATEDYCARNPGTAYRVEMRERELLEQPLTPPGLDLARLDTAPATENCQNEPAPDSPEASLGTEEEARDEPEGLLTPPLSGAGGQPGRRFCQNEPAPEHKTLSLSEGGGQGGGPFLLSYAPA